MQFMCYAYPRNEIMDAAAFVAFRADNKFVMGVLPSGDERLLLSSVTQVPGDDRPQRQRVTLKGIETGLQGMLRASRDVLVVDSAALEVVGAGYQRQVRTIAGEYSLSRRQDVRPFEVACARNAESRSARGLIQRGARLRASQAPAAQTSSWTPQSC